MQNIQRAFIDLQKKLETKREAMTALFTQIYDKELARLEEKLRPLQKFDENLVKVD